MASSGFEYTYVDIHAFQYLYECTKAAIDAKLDTESEPGATIAENFTDSEKRKTVTTIYLAHHGSQNPPRKTNIVAEAMIRIVHALTDENKKKLVYDRRTLPFAHVNKLKSIKDQNNTEADDVVPSSTAPSSARMGLSYARNLPPGIGSGMVLRALHQVLKDYANDPMKFAAYIIRFYKDNSSVTTHPFIVAGLFLPSIVWADFIMADDNTKRAEARVYMLAAITELNPDRVWTSGEKNYTVETETETVAKAPEKAQPSGGAPAEKRDQTDLKPQPQPQPGRKPAPSSLANQAPGYFGGRAKRPTTGTRG